MFKLFAIQDVVLLANSCLTVSVGVEGLMKAVSLSTCLAMPLGGVWVEMAVSMIFLWCTACKTLK